MTAPSNPFDEASILADARAADGLTDFGDPAFREPLRVLLASLDEAFVIHVEDIVGPYADRSIAIELDVTNRAQIDAAFREKLADLSASIDRWESVTKDVNFPPE